MKFVAYFLILSALVILVAVFWPVANEEIKYNFNQMTHVTYALEDEQTSTFVKPLTPPNKDFSIVIPKIAAVAPIIADVDPTNPKIYLPALKRGVAQAEGTAVPPDIGNMYLFAHSTDAFWDVNTYNAVFYLIGKLQNGDEIDVFWKGNLYKYQVYDKRVVDPNDTKYLGTLIKGEKTLTLQTCYPPGTTLKRLVVLAKQVSQ